MTNDPEYTPPIEGAMNADQLRRAARSLAVELVSLRHEESSLQALAVTLTKYPTDDEGMQFLVGRVIAELIGAMSALSVALPDADEILNDIVQTNLRSESE